jgi:putative methanogenesis marker 13 metalloprotein
VKDVLHPRPNPIIAAMYTLRDLDVDVILMHGPAGCGFMAARRLEEAGVRVMTTGMQEEDLIYGAEEKLVRILRTVDEKHRPKLIGVVGTCASMIIGESLDRAIEKARVNATVLGVDIHGCSGPNTTGAIRALEVAAQKGVIPQEELERQRFMLSRATAIERERGLTSREYLEPHPGTTKLSEAVRIVSVLRSGGEVAVVLNAKKETAYGFADVIRAVEQAKRKVGGRTIYLANLDPQVGLPRIRRYATEILRDLDEAGAEISEMTGGLDEYPVAGEKAAALIKGMKPDLRVFAGVPHAVPGLQKDDTLVTDQPRELRNYIDQGFEHSVGEIATHADVMAAHQVLYSELGNTIRQVAERGFA